MSTPRFHRSAALLAAILLIVTAVPAVPAVSLAQDAVLTAAVTGTPAALQVEASDEYTCVMKGDSRVICFGATLGNTTRLEPPQNEVFTQFDIGEQHGCGVRPNGTLLCWGGDFHMEGSGVSGTFSQIAAASVETCALDTGGLIHCWGFSYGGTFDGDGYVPLTGQFKFVGMKFGQGCAIRTNGQLACWNVYGSPSAPPSGEFKDLSLGSSHACGVRVNGTLVCWAMPSAPLGSVPTGLIFAKVSAGSDATCAITDDAQLRCWGAPGSPVAGATLPAGSFSQISVGQYHACALRIQGGAVCWGSNSDGQAPTAPSAAVGGPYTVNEGATINLSGSGNDPGGRPVTFAWDLDGDGGFETKDQTPAYTGGEGPAIVSVSLRVCTDQAICGVAKTTVTVTSSWQTRLREDFEAPFPQTNGWRFYGGEPNWAAVACSPFAGTYAGWPAGTLRPGCAETYAPNQNAYMYWGPADLRASRAARLRFRLKRDLVGSDELFALVSFDAVNFRAGWRYTGSSAGQWEALDLDLADIPSLTSPPDRLSALGADAVYIAFLFRSDDLGAARGPTLDDIKLRTCDVAGCGGPGPTPAGATSWYFAEGWTGPGFDEYLTIQNPAATAAELDVTYFLTGASPVVKHVSVPAASRYTITVHDEREGVGRNGGRGWPVSTRVVSTNGVPVVVERPMYFTYTSSGLANVTGGHNVMGVTAPRQRWLFAEGYTGTGFDEYLTIMNPNASPAPVVITYYLGSGGPVVKQLTVPANARYTVVVHEPAEGVGRGQEVSALVETSLAGGIVVERPIYFRYGGSLGGVTGGHNVMGAAEPRAAWHFPDGNTQDGYDLYLTLMNRFDQAGQVLLTYYVVGESTPRTKEISVAASSRKTVAVHEETDGVGRGKMLGVTVESLNGVGLVVERPMYFQYSPAVNGGHNVLGASAARRTWLFAEGYTGAGFDEYLVVLNPNATAASVTITYYLGQKAPVQKALSVPPESRVAVQVFELAQGVGRGEAVSAKVETTHGGGIVVERPIYFVYEGGRDGGHTVLGYAP